MVEKKKDTSVKKEIDAAKMECMRIRFRRVLGEDVSAHTIKMARKTVANCARKLYNSNDMRGKDA